MGDIHIVRNRGGHGQASISMIRLIAMIMIIACHMFQYYDNELCRWLNVGVYIFFVVSGFLYGTKEIDNPVAFLKKTFTKILVPYYLFLCTAICLYVFICPLELGGTKNIIKAMLCAGTLPGLGHLWFVGYILFCYLITPYLYWLRKSLPEPYPFAKILMIYLFTFLAIQVLGFAFSSFFLPDRVSAYVIGFFSADLIARFGNRIEWLLLWCFMMVALIFNGVEIYTKYIWNLALSGMYETIFNALCRYAHLFLGVALFFCMYECFKNIHYYNILKASDKYSYSIYIVHQLFILSPFSLMSITSCNVINWVIVLILIALSGIMLKHCFKMAN